MEKPHKHTCNINGDETDESVMSVRARGQK